MSTTTVRLDDGDKDILDRLAPAFGGRSNAIRQALRVLSAQVDREDALDEFLQAWRDEVGPVDEAAVQAMAERYDI